jgi:hypothetical protein
MVQLTEAIIKGKTRLDKLSEVKNLNLWGQDITGWCAELVTETATSTQHTVTVVKACACLQGCRTKM